MLIIITACLICCGSEGVGFEKIDSKELALRVEGMVCEYGCARFIEKEVAKLTGVSDCKVNFEKKTALILYNNNALSSEEIMGVISALNEGQYKVNKIKLSPDAEIGKERKKNNPPNQTSVSTQFPQLITYFMGNYMN